MAINRANLISLWDLEDLPACDRGLELAKDFFVSAGIAVDGLGVADPVTQEINLVTRWRELVEHRSSCPNCNEE